MNSSVSSHCEHQDFVVFKIKGNLKMTSWPLRTVYTHLSPFFGCFVEQTITEL